MLTFAVKKKRTPSIAPKSHAPTVSPMSHSLHLQQAKVRHILRGPTLQAKLTITAPNDKYEQEADRVADEVMRMPEPGVQRQVEPEEEETLQTKPLVNQITPLVEVQRQEELEEEEETFQAKPLAGQITPLVQRQPDPVEEEEEEEAIQQKNNTGMAPQVTPEVAHDIHSFKGTGQPLPASERAFFEPRFGGDFGNVRLHTDNRAARTARFVNARAFTLGRDVVFGTGQYAPESSRGKQLLAHELTHVVQQNGNLSLQNKNDVLQDSPKSTCPEWKDKEPIHSRPIVDQITPLVQRQAEMEIQRKPTAKALKAVQEAENMRKQQDPAIWFDDWRKDRRDNNNDGNVDDILEKTLSRYDGLHYSKTPMKAFICKNDKRHDDSTCNKEYIKVRYLVCIDIPRLAYHQAKIRFPWGKRRIRNVVSLLKKNRYYRGHWKILKYRGRNKRGYSGPFQAGDFIASNGHSGIAFDSSNVINLPGPSRKAAGPNAKNDIEKGTVTDYFVARPRI